MSYEFDIVEVAPVTLAVCESFTTQEDIPKRITKMFDIVYTWLRESSVKQVGNNYAIYDQFGADANESWVSRWRIIRRPRSCTLFGIRRDEGSTYETSRSVQRPACSTCGTE